MNKTTPEKLYARVALADPMREEILRLLFGKIEGLPFYKIKRMLNIDYEAALYRNLNTLRLANLIERKGDCYTITQIGRAIIPDVPNAIHKILTEAFASGSFPKYYPGEQGLLGA